MIVRECAGGIVFYKDQVFLICNDKHEWAFPKGVIKDGAKLKELAVERLKVEAGIEARIVAPCGKSSYEFYSVQRQKPVHNNISWFVMTTDSDKVVVDTESGFTDGKFFAIEEALVTVTYSQDRSLLMIAYQRYKETL